MSDAVGQVSFGQGQGQDQFQKPFSEATGKLIDEEVSCEVPTALTWIELRGSPLRAVA